MSHDVSDHRLRYRPSAVLQATGDIRAGCMTGLSLDSVCNKTAGVLQNGATVLYPADVGTKCKTWDLAGEPNEGRVACGLNVHMHANLHQSASLHRQCEGDV